MKTNTRGKLVILSGPSGVGKGPLTKALMVHLKTIGKRMKKHVLYTNRSKRRGEVDGDTYHYVTTDELRKQEGPDFNVFPVHEQLQGMDVAALCKEISENDLVFLEIYHERIPEVMNICNVMRNIPVKSIFITPLSEDDFATLGCGQDRNLRAIAVQSVMQTKLRNRNTESPEKIVARSKNAYSEIENHKGGRDTLLVNHYGEDAALLWESLQGFLSRPRGLDMALNDEKLQYIAKVFTEFLEKIGLRYDGYNDEDGSHDCLVHLNGHCKCVICGKTYHQYESDDHGAAASGKIVKAWCKRCGAGERFYGDTGTVIETWGPSIRI